MALDRFGVWSPHRDSNSVRSLKAALSFRPEPWQWHEDKEQASWWVIDGTLTTLSSLTDALLQQKKRGPVHALLLAPGWNYIEDPIWSFFKVPLNIKLLYGWIDLRLEQDRPAAERHQPAAVQAPVVAPVAILVGRQLKLKRWPNLPHYTAHGNPTDAVSLALACAKLLEDWTPYEEALAIASNAALFNTILADAQIHGILEISAPEPDQKSAQPLRPAPTRSAEKTSAWSLVKRLLNKLA